MIVEKLLLAEYSKTDYILHTMNSVTTEIDGRMISDRWLRESMPKRLIHHLLYGDLLSKSETKKAILDVGGGYTSLTRLLHANNDYSLLDVMAHDSATDMRSLEKMFGKQFWIDEDWYRFDVRDKRYDIVIANDLFPNVDQRLELFLKKFIPVCSEIRLSLTYWNTPRFYTTKRIDADEIMCMLAWDGDHLKHVLQNYAERISKNTDLELLLENGPSLFQNLRQVAITIMRGDLKLERRKAI